MREKRHDILFEPLEVGAKVLRNRFYSTPHASFVPGRRLSDIAFRRMKAEGGWAAVCGGVISIRPDAWGGFVPRIWDDDERVMLGRVATEVRGQGALAGIEFGHGGSHGEGAKFSPAMGVSQLSDPDRTHVVPKEMEISDIEGLLQDWVEAARTASELGYDIVYAYGSHGTLPAQFLSPVLNKRRDRYGGNLANRARFWLEMIQGMKAAVADRSLVVARIAAEGFSPFGTPMEETLEFVRMADRHVDMWDVNVGFGWSPDSTPSRSTPEGSQVDFSGRIREVTSKPIIGVGRLSNPDLMAEILHSGVWDLIGGARPSIADPFLPRKIEEGRYQDIRECTGTNFCIAIETAGAGLSCVQNATIGEEYRRGWHPERFTRAQNADDVDVLVVGAGPAGMECARVLGERQIRNVHLVEAADDIGGHLDGLRRLPGLGDWGRLIDWRKIQLDSLENVEVITKRRLSADDVMGYGADLVVLATGSRWMTPADQWHLADLTRFADAGVDVVSPEAIIEGGVRPPGPIVVWDADGGPVAVGIAEMLASEGASVTFLSRAERVAPQLDLTFEGVAVRQRLRHLSVVARTGARLDRVTSDGVIAVDVNGVEERFDTAALVLVTQRVSVDDLYREVMSAPRRLVETGIQDVVRIGDCLAPRHFGLAMADGHRLGREIDSGNPRRPLRPRAERDVDAGIAEFEPVELLGVGVE